MVRRDVVWVFEMFEGSESLERKTAHRIDLKTRAKTDAEIGSLAVKVCELQFPLWKSIQPVQRVVSQHSPFFILFCSALVAPSPRSLESDRSHRLFPHKLFATLLIWSVENNESQDQG